VGEKEQQTAPTPGEEEDIQKTGRRKVREKERAEHKDAEPSMCSEAPSKEGVSCQSGQKQVSNAQIPPVVSCRGFSLRVQIAESNAQNPP
jgi:hypothetical protein